MTTLIHPVKWQRLQQTYDYSTTLSDRHRQYVSGIYSIENSATTRDLWPASWSKSGGSQPTAAAIWSKPLHCSLQKLNVSTGTPVSRNRKLTG